MIKNGGRLALTNLRIILQIINAEKTLVKRIYSNYRIEFV